VAIAATWLVPYDHAAAPNLDGGQRRRHADRAADSSGLRRRLQRQRRDRGQRDGERVNIASGNLPLTACASFDRNNSQSVEVNELILGVNGLLNGCA
jgi:hypothetical protein